MNRKYNERDFSAILDKARVRIKGLSITTDIIVGFPGETAEEFKNTLELAKNAGFLKAHIFTYSDREGTKAFSMGSKVPEP